MPCVPSEREKLPPGKGEMPEGRVAFAEAVFARVDLVEAWTRLVNSDDGKIAQRALEKLDEMKYQRDDGRDEESRDDQPVLPRRRD
ncbi:MAG TPA: hypothetical protein VGH83_12015 [Candidatus Acidoferrum sp.]|jgi:hypothetical protein